MALKTRTITEPKVLVVEGKDDKNFFEALIEHLGLRNIQVEDIGGKTQLRDRLKALVQTPGFPQVTSLGVVRDANNDHDAAFQSVCGALLNAGLRVPERPWITVGGEPKVVVVILPKENENGMLEDLCLEAKISDPAMPCVNQYFECLESQGLDPPINLSKARIHTFLASRRKPDLRLGEAAKKGYWPFEDSAFEEVKTFLQRF